MALPDPVRDSEIEDSDLWNLGRKFEIEQDKLRTALAEEGHYQIQMNGKDAALRYGGVIETLISDKFAPIDADIDMDLLRRARRGELESSYPSRLSVIGMFILFGVVACAELAVFGIQVYRGASYFILIPAVFLLFGGITLGIAWKDENKWALGILGISLILSVSIFRAWDEYFGFDWTTFFLLLISGLAIAGFEALAFEMLHRRKKIRADQLRCQGWEARTRHRTACSENRYRNLYLSYVESLEDVGPGPVADELDSAEI